MYVRIKKPVGIMSAIVDEAKRKSEVLDVDAISSESEVKNNIDGKAHFSLVLGGVDSNGTFHPCPKHLKDNIANIVLERNSRANPDQHKAYDALFRDENGNFRHHYPDSWYGDLMRTLIPIAHKMIWGGQFPDMEVTMDGELIFQPDHLKPKTAQPEKPPKPTGPSAPIPIERSIAPSLERKGE